jgi:hypothetical protein
MKEDPREKWINYLTVAGLVGFVLLSLIYLNLDAISQINIDFSLDSGSGISLPGLPNINFDWFNAMDPASKLIFGFLVTILAGSLIGSALLLIVRKRASARK